VNHITEPLAWGLSISSTVAEKVNQMLQCFT